MDAQRFDRIARSVATSSRRRLLTGLLGTAGGLLLGRRGSPPARAQNAAGSALCLNSSRLCAADQECNIGTGEVCCFGSCVNLPCDVQNCGRCGQRCDDDTRCTAGVCLPPGICPIGMRTCGSMCCSARETCGADQFGDLCQRPADLDYLGTTLVCAPARGDTECSLQRIYGQDRIFACGLDLLGPLFRALRAVRVADTIETLDFAAGMADVMTTQSGLEHVEAALGLVLPTGCIIGLADAMSGGQYTALELCLADEGCTRELLAVLGS